MRQHDRKMEIMIMKHTFRFGALFLLAAAPFLYADVSYQVTVDTTPLAGHGGNMAFDLFAGNPAQNNLATLTFFTTSSTLSSGSTSGDVAGSLTPGPLVETADQFFNEWLQVVTFSAGVTTFDLNLTTNFVPGSTPDSFSFSLLNPSLIPFVTSDPTGSGRLFAIDLVGGDTAPQVFTSAFATATVTAIGAGAPEPNLLPFGFIGFGLMLAVRVIFKRKQLARR
jgi:hypothetical protein